MKQRVSILALVLACAAPVAAAPKAPAAKGHPRAEASVYLEELERRGLVDKTLGTPERLANEVRAADDELVAGNSALAAARLYAIVEGPRYQDLDDTEDFQDAEYRLGLALHRGGGSMSARRYFVKALARGPKAPFYLAALRAYVDVCLDEHALPACVAEIDRLGAEDQNEELAYLRGRDAFEAAQLAAAEDELKRVTPKSRFYSSALYLRGVMAVKQKDFKKAQDAFCTVADTKDGDALRFYIDGRYYALRDLARLALGRVAHEEGRYEDAFYHYFLIPQDSNRLAEALFEAAWSSLQRREHDLGARLVEEFLKTFPRSPKVPEAKLLLATLQVKTCRFAEAEKGFSEFITNHEPLMAAIDKAIADPAARGALAQKLLARAENAPMPEHPTSDDRIAEQLEVDGQFFRVQALARGLRGEALDAGHIEGAWGQLVSKVAGTPVQATGGALMSVATLRERTAELARELKHAKQPELELRRRALMETLDRALDMQVLEDKGPVGAAGLLPLLKADGEHAAQLRARVAALGKRLDDASGELIRQALVDLRAHTEDLVRRARLGKIDSVVGQKRKLEKQIEDLAAGRFPPEMFGKLHIEGLIKDDEEYWPPEKEIWLDEYENYK